MIKLWKTNTIVFVLQVIAVALTHLVTNDISLTFFAAAIASVLRPPFVSPSSSTGNIQLAALFVIAAAAAYNSFLDGVTALGALLLAFVFIAYGIKFFCSMAASDEDDGNPYWQRFICAVPLGIGTILGGLLLLYLNRKKGQAI